MAHRPSSTRPDRDAQALALVTLLALCTWALAWCQW